MKTKNHLQRQEKTKLILKQLDSFLTIFISIVEVSFIDTSIKEKLLTCCKTAGAVLYFVNNYFLQQTDHKVRH